MKDPETLEERTLTVTVDGFPFSHDVIEFRCAGCKRWVNADQGGTDDLPDHCDRCWARAHRKAG